jgi:hypothetical protein
MGTLLVRYDVKRSFFCGPFPVQGESGDGEWMSFECDVKRCCKNNMLQELQRLARYLLINLLVVGDNALFHAVNQDDAVLPRG